MMSKERELLKECRLMLDNPINGTAGRNLQIKITELLAQPDPIEDKFDRVKNNREFYQAGYAEAELKLKREQEQEPVAWIDDGCNGLIKQDTIRGYVMPLYTAPPKREPLSDLRIRTANRNEYFEWGVRFAEKAHGITGVDDE